jgi:hypothetical protein
VAVRSRMFAALLAGCVFLLLGAAVALLLRTRAANLQRPLPVVDSPALVATIAAAGSDDAWPDVRVDGRTVTASGLTLRLEKLLRQEPDAVVGSQPAPKYLTLRLNGSSSPAPTSACDRFNLKCREIVL